MRPSELLCIVISQALRNLGRTGDGSVGPVALLFGRRRWLTIRDQSRLGGCLRWDRLSTARSGRTICSNEDPLSSLDEFRAMSPVPSTLSSRKNARIASVLPRNAPEKRQLAEPSCHHHRTRLSIEFLSARAQSDRAWRRTSSWSQDCSSTGNTPARRT